MPLGNTLYYGDNLTIMDEKIHSQSVDLIYLDPPFKSDQNYNLMYRNKTGRAVPESEHAFADTWEMDASKVALAQAMPKLLKDAGLSDHVVDFWKMWTKALSDAQPHLLAYLIYMVPRLLQMRRILRDHGSIYLHCDPTASHYIKVMMDAIFDHSNFRNEIVWKRTGAHSASKRWNDVHDTILFYSKSDKYTWNRAIMPHSDEYVARYKRVDANGGRWTDDNLTAPGVRHGESGAVWRGFDVTRKESHWKISNKALEKVIPPDELAAMGTLAKLDALDKHGLIYWPTKDGKQSFPRFKRYLGEGQPVQDVITDINVLNSQSKERLGYPTQKPTQLLKRIIEASSNPGDVVFDPFCGCGTTVYASQELGRTWVCCDITIIAIGIVKEVLDNKYRLSEDRDYKIDGIPVSVDQAEKLAAKNKSQFQDWAAEVVGGYPNKKKSGDLGIDGSIWFDTHDGMKKMVLSVKGGAMKPADVRDLRGVLEREGDCELAGLISLHEPSKAMRSEAAKAGMFEFGRESYPRIQLLSVSDVLEHRRGFHTPTRIKSKVSTGQAALPLT